MIGMGVNAMIVLARTIQMPDGLTYKRGQPVSILGHWYELGTHRDLVRATIDEHKYVLLPDDIEEEN